jgi:hypothetical protein
VFVIEGDKELRVDQIQKAYGYIEEISNPDANFCSEVLISDSLHEKTTLIILAAGFD